MLLVFGILGMTNEYRHGTITYSYLVTPRRWQVMVMKLVVYALVGIVTMLVAVVLVYVVIRIGGSIRGVDIDATGGATIGDYARQIVVAGLITTFGVRSGRALPRPGHHRRRRRSSGRSSSRTSSTCSSRRSATGCRSSSSTR